jgi:hypothetical protein
MMNAVHDLPLIVARDEGFFRDEGLDVEILKTPGSTGTLLITGRCAATSSNARWRRPTKMVSRPVSHVRVGIMTCRQSMSNQASFGQDRGARLRHVELRDRHRSKLGIYRLNG